MFGIAIIGTYFAGVATMAAIIEGFYRLDTWLAAGGEMTHAERKALDGAFQGVVL